MARDNGGVPNGLFDLFTGIDEALVDMKSVLIDIRDEIRSLSLSGVGQSLDRGGRDLEEILGDGIVGTASEGISSGESGDIVFDVNGTQRVLTLEANGSVEAGESVKTITDGAVIPFTDADEASGTTLKGVGIKRDSSTEAGDQEAAEIKLGNLRKDVDVIFRVQNVNGSIVVEDSEDSNSWNYLNSIPKSEMPEDGEGRIQVESPERYVRAYFGGGFEDSDVHLIKVVSKGV